MTIASVPALVDALRPLPVLDAKQWDELNLSLQKVHSDPRLLARELVQRGWLTAYQVNQLFQGRGGELVLGQYLVLEKLGEGDMGVVYKARHSKMRRLVAIKVIRKERLANEASLRRFYHEVRAAAQLDHPNVVHAFDADQVGETHMLVMEYVDGPDLGQLVKQQGPLPVEIACEFIRQAALGLQHAHEKGLIHRDIKPSNLLLAKGAGPGVVKILDLGLARLANPLGEESGSTLTHEGAVVGTPDYISPEQARQSHQADIRSDLYSLGCTFYYLLTGRPPFPGGSLGEKLVKHQLAEPPLLEQLRPGLHPGVASLVRKLMAKGIEDRYQTPAELAAVLELGLKQNQWPGPYRPRSPTSGFPMPPPVALQVPAGQQTAASAPQGIPSEHRCRSWSRPLRVRATPCRVRHLGPTHPSSNRRRSQPFQLLFSVESCFY